MFTSINKYYTSWISLENFYKPMLNIDFFVNLDNIYGEYFPEYSNYFWRPLRLMKSKYGMTNSGNLFSDKLTNFLIDEVGFNQSNFKISVCYKYAPDGSNLFVLYYVDACVYLYTSEELYKWVLDTLGKRFYLNFLI